MYLLLLCQMRDNNSLNREDCHAPKQAELSTMKLGLPDKGRAIKGWLVVWNVWDRARAFGNAKRSGLCCFQPSPEGYESRRYFNLRNEGIYQYVSQSNPCGKMTLLPTKHLGIVIIQKFDIPWSNARNDSRCTVGILIFIKWVSQILKIIFHRFFMQKV